MRRRTCTALSLMAVAAAGTFLAPPAQSAPLSAEVVKAVLQADGSVMTQVSLTCPKRSSFSVLVAVSQEFSTNGSLYEAVAYSPAVVGSCTGKAQRVAAHTTASDRAPFQRYSGRVVPADATGPTLGVVRLTISPTNGGPAQEREFRSAISLR